MQIETDIWMSPQDACSILGEGWVYEDGEKSIKLLKDGCKIASRPVFDGSEHNLARKGMVVFSHKELDMMGLELEVKI